MVGVATEQIELYSTEAVAGGTGAEAKMIRQSNQSVNQLMATGKARTVCQANKGRKGGKRREKVEAGDSYNCQLQAQSVIDSIECWLN